MDNALPADHRVLHRLLADFCEQLLGARIRLEDQRVISSEDVAAHFTALGDHLRQALEQHEREPSPTAAAVVTTMAMLFHDRAMLISSRPSGAYRAVRTAVQGALSRVVVGQRVAVGNLNLRLILTWRTLDQLRELVETGRPLTVEGLSPERGIVLTADDREVYRFRTFTSPEHSCAHPAEIRPKDSVVFTSATPEGQVAFKAACGCRYMAAEPLLDRD